MWASTKSFLGSLTKEKLIGYFLILWGASFFFEAIVGFIEASYSYVGARAIASNYLGVLIDLIYLAIAAVLALLGLKFLGINISTAAPPTAAPPTAAPPTAAPPTAAPPTVRTAKFCRYCGKELPSDAVNFCPNCGGKIQ
ncbi:MAG: zinc ribbon domain-containing protein [Candidatus Bathyarchaeia archaeon]|jgi:hypothetical protein